MAPFLTNAILSTELCESDRVTLRLNVDAYVMVIAPTEGVGLGQAVITGRWQNMYCGE